MKIKRVFFLSLGIFVFSVFVLLLSVVFEAFAEVYSDTVSSLLRIVLSSVTGFFSFSLAEILVFILIPVLVLVGILSVVFIITNPKKLKKLLCVFLSAVFVLSSLFLNGFGVCYFRSPIEENMLLDRKSLSRQELYNCSMILKTKLEETLDNVSYNEQMASVNPHSWRDLNTKIDIGFDELSKLYDFITPINALPKRLVVSPLMTYTHISGIYMPFTGEANINTNYPDYVVAFTVAHEKAHQRGIAPEDEANFVAFLALVMSGDDYLEYSAYMSMYDYFLDSMYEHDAEMYTYLLKNSDRRVLGEMYAYSVFFDKYRNSQVSEIADTVNDTYIKAMGDSKGVESYGRVVELVYAYINEKSLP